MKRLVAVELLGRQRKHGLELRIVEMRMILKLVRTAKHLLWWERLWLRMHVMLMVRPMKVRGVQNWLRLIWGGGNVAKCVGG